MAELYACPHCGRRYRADKLLQCPGCQEETSENAGSVIQSGTSRATYSRVMFEADQKSDWLSLVDAQNRTTYAVRSISLFLLITTVTALVGFICYFLYLRGLLDCNFDAACLESQSRWEYLGPSIAAIGLVAGIVIGMLELRASKPH
jgi:hypothetical protein